MTVACRSHAAHGDPRAEPRLVPADRIGALVLAYKHKHRLCWTQLAHLLGLDGPEEAETLARCTRLPHERACIVLRVLAGLPRPPTPQERLLAERERAARQQRARRRRKEGGAP